jgi:hypothetical protein
VKIWKIFSLKISGGPFLEVILLQKLVVEPEHERLKIQKLRYWWFICGPAPSGVIVGV